MDENDLSILGYIPARADSKGIPNKHLRQLNGKRVIEYTLEAALESSYLDKIVVSTDSREVADIAIQYGVEVPFMRPGNLAGDSSVIVDSITHLIDYLEKYENYSPDIFVSLFPTNPFRRQGFVDEVIKQFLADKCKANDEGIHVAQLLACTEWPQGNVQYLQKTNDERGFEFWQGVKNVSAEKDCRFLRISGSISPHVYSLKVWKEKFGVKMTHTPPDRSDTGNEQWENSNTKRKMIRKAFVLKNEESVELDDPIDYFRAIAIARCTGKVR